MDKPGYSQRMFFRTVRLVALAGVGIALSACASAPKYQGLTASQLYARAQQEFEHEDYGDAAETLEFLLRASPSFEQGAEAQLLLARAYFEDKQFITAQAEYTRFLDRYPAHPSAPDAALGVCRSNEALSPISQRDQTFTQQALQVCGNMVTDYAGTPQAEEAQRIVTEMQDKLAKKVYDNGHYYLRRDFNDSAIIYFQSVVDRYPGTEWAPRALVGIIDAYTAIGYDDEVEAARQRLLNEYPDSPEAQRISASAQGDGSDGAGGTSGSR